MALSSYKVKSNLFSNYSPPLLSICNKCFKVNIIFYQDGLLNINCNKCKYEVEMEPEEYLKHLKSLRRNNPNQMVKRNYEVCINHTDKECKYFCNSCLVNYCELCENQHIDHPYFCLNDYINKYKNIIFTRDELVNNIKERFEFLKKNLKKIKIKLSAKLNKTEKKSLDKNYELYVNENNKLFEILNIIINTYTDYNYESINNVFTNISFPTLNEGEINDKEDFIFFLRNNDIIKTRQIDINKFIREKKQQDLIEAENYFEKGNSLYDTNKYSEALINYNKAIKLNRNNEYYYFNRGNTLYNLKKYNEAILNYDSAIKFNANNEKYYYYRAICLEEIKNYEEAIINYSKALEFNPKDDNYYFNRGICLFYLTKYNDAILNYDKAIKINPKNDKYYYNRGFSLYNIDKYDKAITNYDKAIKINPNCANYYYSRGNSLYIMKKFNQASLDYEKAISLNPSNEFYYYSNGNSLYNMKNYDDARFNYNKAIKLNPNNPLYYYFKGNCLCYINKNGEAILNYDKAIELNKNDDNSYFGKGNCFYNMSKYDEAIMNYDNAIKINPNDDNYYYYKGLCLSQLEKYDEALINYENAIKINPEGKYYDNLKICQQLNRQKPIKKKVKKNKK